MSVGTCVGSSTFINFLMLNRSNLNPDALLLHGHILLSYSLALTISISGQSSVRYLSSDAQCVLLSLSRSTFERSLCRSSSAYTSTCRFAERVVLLFVTGHFILYYIRYTEPCSS